MRASWLRLALPGLLMLTLAGCGGGGGGGNNPQQPTGTTVTFTFINGIPTAAAVQTGVAGFTQASVQNGQLQVLVPNGTTRYSIAYVCPSINFGRGAFQSQEFVVQATIQDGIAFTLDCFAYNTSTASVTVDVDATSIPGAAQLFIEGAQGGTYSIVNSNKGSFVVNMPIGMNDVAISVLDGSFNLLAIRILRGQTVPGPINGGNTITIGPQDLFANEPVSVNNVPPGDLAVLLIQLHTVNGTSLGLLNQTLMQYAALPAASIQSGDYYSYQVSTSAFHVGALQTATSGVGPVTMTVPDPWTYFGPKPAAFPTFTFNYSGNLQMPLVAQEAVLRWSTPEAADLTLSVIATASFQSGANTITLPNLPSQVNGFLPPQTSGNTVAWYASIYGGNKPFIGLQMNAAFSFVSALGQFTEP